jgi:RNA polymerase sigma-70 factor (ECF subfamily)
VNRAADDTRLSDADLVSRAQRGDSSAFATLVTKYQHRVYNTCYRMCHNPEDALDLTQSAFLKALEALPRFEARASFFTWLFRIAVNLVLSHRRAQRRRPVLSLRQSDDEGRPYEPPAEHAADDPSRHAEQAELRQRLEDALLRLDAEFRAAVVLRDVERLEYAAIAEILELPVGTVKSRIHRGRLMLRALLEQKEPKLGIG